MILYLIAVFGVLISMALVDLEIIDRAFMLLWLLPVALMIRGILRDGEKIEREIMRRPG